MKAGNCCGFSLGKSALRRKIGSPEYLPIYWGGGPRKRNSGKRPPLSFPAESFWAAAESAGGAGAGGWGLHPQIAASRGSRVMTASITDFFCIAEPCSKAEFILLS